MQNDERLRAWSSYLGELHAEFPFLHGHRLQAQLKQQGTRVSRPHVATLVRKMASADSRRETAARSHSFAGTCRLNGDDPQVFDINAVNRRLATIKP